MGVEERQMVLHEAEACITKDRAAAHGQPEDNFKAIAELWTAQGVTIDGMALKPTDVALMMIGMKLARLRHNAEHRDSWVDVAGYAACGWDTVVVPSAHSDALKAMLEGVNERLRGEGGSKILTLIDNLNEAIDEESGWVSDYRCNKYEPHPAHKCGPQSSQWCDGYKKATALDNPQKDAEAC